MGARQSKRSVDITTATSAAPESGGEVVAGKLGKLEDGMVPAENVAGKQNGDAVLKGADETATAATPGGDVPSPSRANEEQTKESVAPQNESAKPEETPKTPEPAPTPEKTDVPKPLNEEKCEKPVIPENVTACDKPTVCDKLPTVQETLVKDPVPAEPEQTKTSAVDLVEPATVVETEKKVEEPVKAEAEAVAEVPVPENVIAKQDTESVPPPPIEEQKEVCDHSPPPPLPISSPPSQVSAFAETMLAHDNVVPTALPSEAPTTVTTSAEAETCSLPKDITLSVTTDLNDKKENDNKEEIPQPETTLKSEVVETPQSQVQVVIQPETPVQPDPPVIDVVQSVANPQPDLPPAPLPVSQVITTPDVPVAATPEVPNMALENLPVTSQVESPTVLENLPITSQVESPPVETQTPVTTETEITVVKQEGTLPLEEQVEKPVLDPKIDTPEAVNKLPELVKKLPESNKVEDTELIKLESTRPIDNIAELSSKCKDIVIENVELQNSEKKIDDLPSPPPSPASVQEAQPNSDSITAKTESGENLPSPPPSPLSAQDTSVSESVAANTITEDPLPSPPHSPEISSRDVPVVDSALPPKEAESGSFDDLAPLPPPPSVVNSNDVLMCPPPLEISNGVHEKLLAQQEKTNEIAEVSATESTLSEISVTKDITEKVAGMMLDDVPPVDIPAPIDSTVAIADN
uniref:Putative fibrous sheath cabyr-binding protein-like isoform x5 n=1 Tax=Xenopsylla cheopis TaxID=163159 RepID=A0A6M2DQ19_XENCH